MLSGDGVLSGTRDGDGVLSVFYGTAVFKVSVLPRLQRSGSVCQEKHKMVILLTCVWDIVSISLMFNTSRKLAREQW